MDTKAPKQPVGRPPMDPAERACERFEMRLSKRHKDKLDALGGAEWVRRKIIEARVPAKEDSR